MTQRKKMLNLKPPMNRTFWKLHEESSHTNNRKRRMRMRMKTRKMRRTRKTRSS